MAAILDIDSDINNKTKLAFIRLPQKMNEDIWLTFWNFYRRNGVFTSHEQKML
jgi:hypothetical protein